MTAICKVNELLPGSGLSERFAVVLIKAQINSELILNSNFGKVNDGSLNVSKA